MKFTTFPDNINPFTKNTGIVKFGIDPTGPDMHLGHLLPIRIVKKLKELGHEIHIILGTFTAQIGDATGRDSTRPILSAEETKKNSNILLEQVTRILGNNIIIHRNNEWFDKMSLPEMMNIISKFSVQKLLSRDNFSKRVEGNVPIAMHELMGPILQGIDSVNVRANIEVGGNDQLFNFSITRDVQAMFGQEEEICILSPVINGLDGRKMSKSFNNCIFINDTPEDVFGKSMSISDETMFEWLPIFFDNFDNNEHPMKLKKMLAFKVTEEIWGTELAEKGSRHFESVIQKGKLPEEIIELDSDSLLSIVKTILNSSNSEARRMFRGNAVSVNGEKVSEDFEVKSGDIVKVGKRSFAKIK